MNTPSPLVPKGSLQEQSQGRSNIRVWVVTVIAIHVVVFGAVLIQGCGDRNKDREGLKSPDSTYPAENTAAANAPDNVVTPPPANPNPVPPAMAPPSVTPSNPVVVATPPPVVVPPAVPSVPPPVVGDGTVREHTIASGDTFGSLAKKYGVTSKGIQDANPGVDSRRLKIGQKIKIPPQKAATPATPTAGGPAGAPAPDTAGGTSYAVKSGDNLTKIAKSHGISVKALRAANSLRTDQLKVGQKLTIPPGKTAAVPAATAPGAMTPAPGVAPAPTGAGAPPTMVPTFTPPPAPGTPPSNP